jgi:hypothetical protein
MNLPLCWWLWKRARLHGDHLEIMVHEPFLPFRMGLWRQNAAALIHRFMTILLLQAAARVWVATPAWEQRWRPYLLGRRIPFAWLPIPSNVLPDENDSATQIVRQRYAPHEKILIGHFGTHGPAVTTLLEPILLGLKERATAQTVLLIGIGSQEFEEKLLRRRPELRDLVQATGPLSSQDLSRHLAACDVLIQPYPGGLSCRNSSLMAGLSHGKPIVTTRGILSEPFWQESHAVALVEEGQTSAFLDRVQQLHDNPGERARLGREAQNFYRDRFDVSNTVRSLRNACAGPTLERRISRLAPHLYSLYLAVVIILFIAIRVLSSGTWRMLRHP